jgi:hypothetical protein
MGNILFGHKIYEILLKLFYFEISNNISHPEIL